MKKTSSTDMAIWNRRLGVDGVQQNSTAAKDHVPPERPDKRLPFPDSEKESSESPDDETTRRAKERFLAQLNLRPRVRVTAVRKRLKDLQVK